MTGLVLDVRGLDADTPEGRPLFRDLSVGIGHERAAIVGRNGVGKSTLLRILAGQAPLARGSVVRRGEVVLVPQDPEDHEVERATRRLRALALGDGARARALARDAAEAGLGSPLAWAAGPPSRGEARKRLLLAAKHSPAALLLLDEPTEDLDEAGVAWLCRWLRAWERGAIVASHHRGLLQGFEHFLLVAESGCRHVATGFEGLEQMLEAEARAREHAYVQRLRRLEQQEREDEQIRRRRERKKNVGRLHELRRRTSRCRLNEKRGQAQVSQGRAAAIREDRIAAVRGWARAARRALTVRLPLVLQRPVLPPGQGRPLVALEGVAMAAGDRVLFSGVSLRLERQRLAIVGPNGAGKTTLVRLMLGEVRPTAGTARAELDRVGVIAQGAEGWATDESLLEHLVRDAAAASLDEAAAMVVAHELPLALAERPLRSLSPGERVRAALVCLFRRAPGVELLVLDEPTAGLDFVGIAALQRALAAWPGGLVVVSHDRELLDGIGIDQTLRLDGRGGHRLA